MTALRGARTVCRDPEGLQAALCTCVWVGTRACQDIAAGEGVQLGGGQVDQAGRVLGQQGPLGGAEALAEILVLPRADDPLYRHHSLLSRTRDGPWPSRVPIPPLVVAPNAGGGGGPTSSVSSSIRPAPGAPGRGALQRGPP